MEARTWVGKPEPKRTIGALIEEQLYARNVKSGVERILALKGDEVAFNIDAGQGSMEVWKPLDSTHAEKMAKAGLTHDRCLFGFAEKDKAHALKGFVFYTPYQREGGFYDHMEARMILLKAMKALGDAGIPGDMTVIVIKDPYGRPEGFQTTNNAGGIFPEVDGTPNHSKATLGEYLGLKT